MLTTFIIKTIFIIKTPPNMIWLTPALVNMYAHNNYIQLYNNYIIIIHIECRSILSECIHSWHIH